MQAPHLKFRTLAHSYGFAFLWASQTTKMLLVFTLICCRTKCCICSIDCVVVSHAKKLCNIWKYIQSSACYRNTANRFFTLLSLQSLSSLLSVICMQLPWGEMTHSQRVSYNALLAPMAICAANKVLWSPYPWQNHVFNGPIINFTLFAKKNVICPNN